MSVIPIWIKKNKTILHEYDDGMFISRFVTAGEEIVL
jgi:hypothetical protein